MERLILIKYGELTTKKENRKMFIKMLVKNINNLISDYEYEIDYDRVRMYINCDNKYIDVLTTYGETSLEQAQTTTSQTQSNSLNKFTANTFDNLGASAQLFNAEGNTALKYSTDKDTSLMFSLAMIYANWLTYIINDKL